MKRPKIEMFLKIPKNYNFSWIEMRLLAEFKGRAKNQILALFLVAQAGKTVSENFIKKSLGFSNRSFWRCLKYVLLMQKGIKMVLKDRDGNVVVEE